MPDLHMYHGDSIGAANCGEGVAKFCLGHEFIGEMVEIGSSALGYKVGDKVLTAGGTGRGRCDLCRTWRIWEMLVCQCHRAKRV